MGDSVLRPAKVPGYVHLDLLDNNIIDSLYWGMNPQKYNFVGDNSWIYKTIINLDKEQSNFKNKVLRFEGIDTYADIYVNDSLVLSTDNMFLAYEIDVTPFLNEGENQLLVHLKSPIKEAEKAIKKYPFYNTGHQKADEKNFRKYTRKAQYQYGWDWACTLIPSGIYRPIDLILFNTYKLNSVYYKQKEVDKAFANYEAQIEINSFEPKTVDFEILVDNKVISTEKNFKLTNGICTLSIPFTVKNPELWWPNGLGKQNLYSFTVNMIENGKTIISNKQNIGIRTIEFINEYDSQGKSYYFKVNGNPVFMKGANYVPIDAMLPSVSKDRYEKMIRDCADANMNMLRIWGGGIYEDDIFYELCDKYGILIYHDFMFASQMPPADSTFLSNVKEEAIYQVKRLRNHACMALWSGGNETESAWFEGFMPKEYPREVYFVDHKKIFDTLLPDIVHKYHPEISYVRSSPTAGTDSISVNKEGYGDTHAWAVWFGRIDFDKAKMDRLSRFISEYGFIGYPPLSSIKKYLPEKEIDTASQVFKFRDAYSGIQDIIKDFIDRYYPQPHNMLEFTYISGLIQAEAMQTSNEIYRRNKPYCMGALLWQLNDVWPVASWSLVDYYGQWKPIMYRTKESFAPVLLSLDQENDSIYVYCVNDKLIDINAKLTLSVIDFLGKEICRKEKNIIIGSNKSQMVYKDAVGVFTAGNNPGSVVLKAQLSDNKGIISSGLHYFKRCKDLKLPEANIEYSITTENGKSFIELKSDKLVKNLYVIDSEGDMHFSNNYFDLLPREKMRIEIENITSQKKIQERISLLNLNQIMNR